MTMPTQPPAIRIVAILGSVRPGSSTAKALALVADEVRKQEGVNLTVIDPAGLRLPLPGLAPGDPQRAAAAQSLRQIVADATGVVLATPEYHGSYSSVIKLVIENLGFPCALATKPVALLGVASGQIGAVKALEHLRSVCSHVGAIVLPATVSVPGVNKVFDAQGRSLDPVIEQRVRSVAGSLLDCIRGNLCPRITLEQMARESAP